MFVIAPLNKIILPVTCSLQKHTVHPLLQWNPSLQAFIKATIFLKTAAANLFVKLKREHFRTLVVLSGRDNQDRFDRHKLIIFFYWCKAVCLTQFNHQTPHDWEEAFLFLLPPTKSQRLGLFDHHITTEPLKEVCLDATLKCHNQVDCDYSFCLRLEIRWSF